MKKLTLFCLSIAISTAGLARDVFVQGYTRQNGTYVEPYHRTSPDNTINNNYGTQGNVNPWTGQAGTKQPDPFQSNYGTIGNDSNKNSGWGNY